MVYVTIFLLKLISTLFYFTLSITLLGNIKLHKIFGMGNLLEIILAMDDVIYFGL